MTPTRLVNLCSADIVFERPHGSSFIQRHTTPVRVEQEILAANQILLYKSERDDNSVDWPIYDYEARMVVKLPQDLPQETGIVIVDPQVAHFIREQNMKLPYTVYTIPIDKFDRHERVCIVDKFFLVSE